MRKSFLAPMRLRYSPLLYYQVQYIWFYIEAFDSLGVHFYEGDKYESIFILLHAAIQLKSIIGWTCWVFFLCYFFYPFLEEYWDHLAFIGISITILILLMLFSQSLKHSSNKPIFFNFYFDFVFEFLTNTCLFPYFWEHETDRKEHKLYL